jgi:hypothetical protein
VSVTGRLLLTVLAVFVVRTSMNAVFYGSLMADQMRAMQQAHPGVFREVIPGFIGTDLVWAAVFCFLFAKVGGALGGGVGGGVKLGILVAILSQVLGNFYIFFSVTYFTPGNIVTDCVYALIAHAIQGAVAGLIYKHPLRPAVV